MQRTLLASAVLALAAFSSRPAGAVDTTWTFNGDGNWTEAAKWSAGEPNSDTFNVFIDDGDTAVTVTLNASRTIGSLSLGTDDTLQVENPFTSNQTLTSANGFNNDGSILLTGTSSGLVTLAITSGTLTNSATGLLHFQIGGSGSRTFSGDLVNNGTVTVDRPTTFNKSGGLYTNNGQFTVNSSLSVSSGGTLTQAAGTLDVNGTLTIASGSALNLDGGTLNLDGTLGLSSTVFTQTAGTINYMSGSINGDFNYLGGVITGTPLLSGATLIIGPAATNPVSFLFTNNSTLASDVHAGQTLTLQISGTVSQALSSADGFTNDGSIVLTGTSSGAAVLSLDSGTLTNSATGLVHFQTGGTGLRTFTGDLLNNGTVIVDRPTTFNKSGGQYTNNATFDVNSTLTIDSAGTFEQAAGTFDLASAITVTGGSAFNLTGGTLAMDGNINLTGGTVFTQSAGTLAYTSGTISTGTFDYEGGTITGTPQLSLATLQIGPAATECGLLPVH